MPPSNEAEIPPIPTIPTDSIEATLVVVDPGQPIKITAWFPNFPPTFSHMAPGADVAVHDPGFGQPGSKVETLGGGVYRGTVDTRGMMGGEGWWYLTNNTKDVADQRAKLGRFTVREHPRALVDRSWTAPIPVATSNYLIGLDALSAPYEALAMVGTPKVPKAVWWLVAGVLLGVVLA